MRTLEELVAWHEVHDLSLRWAEALDQRNWPALRATLAGRVRVDLSGGPPGPPPDPVWADDWVARVSRDLGRFTATQHLLAGHRITIDGDRGGYRAEAQVQHWLTTHRWYQVGGWYEGTVVREHGGWLVSGVTFHQRWDAGDRTSVTG